SLVVFSLQSRSEDQSRTADDLDMGWKQTNINFETLRAFIDDTGTPVSYPCYASAVNLLGCLHLINGLGSSLRPELALVTKEVLSLYPGMKAKVMLDLAGVSLVEFDGWGASETPIAVAAARMKKHEALLRAAAERMLASGQKIDFAALAYRM